MEETRCSQWRSVPPELGTGFVAICEWQEKGRKRRVRATLQPTPHLVLTLQEHQSPQRTEWKLPGKQGQTTLHWHNPEHLCLQWSAKDSAAVDYLQALAPILNGSALLSKTQAFPFLEELLSSYWKVYCLQRPCNAAAELCYCFQHQLTYSDTGLFYWKRKLPPRQRAITPSLWEAELWISYH